MCVYVYIYIYGICDRSPLAYALWVDEAELDRTTDRHLFTYALWMVVAELDRMTDRHWLTYAVWMDVDELGHMTGRHQGTGVGGWGWFDVDGFDCSTDRWNQKVRFEAKITS